MLGGCDTRQMTLDEGAKGYFFCSVAELIRIGDKSKLTRSDICDVCRCILALENNGWRPTANGPDYLAPITLARSLLAMEVAPTGVYSK